MGKMKQLFTDQQEEQEFLLEEERYKRYEAAQAAKEEREKEQKEFDFERDCAARP